MAARINNVRSFTAREHTNEHSTTRPPSSILGTAAMSTIFDKILDGEIPCHKVYEDDHVLAFLDIGPLALGHTLVIPKERKAYLHELSDEASAAIGRVLPRVARAVMQVTGCDQYNILQNNGPRAHQAVFHVHFHIIPKPNEASGLGIRWPSASLDGAAGEDLATKLRDAIG